MMSPQLSLIYIFVCRGKALPTSATSRWLCRLESVSEAYRLVRTLHMQQWRPDLFGDKFVVRASVI